MGYPDGNTVALKRRRRRNDTQTVPAPAPAPSTSKENRTRKQHAGSMYRRKKVTINGRVNTRTGNRLPQADCCWDARKLEGGSNLRPPSLSYFTSLSPLPSQAPPNRNVHPSLTTSGRRTETKLLYSQPAMCTTGTAHGLQQCRGTHDEGCGSSYLAEVFGLELLGQLARHLHRGGEQPHRHARERCLVQRNTRRRRKGGQT